MEVAPVVLTSEEARRLTDEVRKDAEALWHRLVELYDGEAHTVLGYSAWHDYCDAEFGMEQSRAYRLLDAGQVASISQLANAVNEAQARELSPLLKKVGEKAVIEVWEEAQSEPTPPTAKTIRERVQKRLPQKSRKERGAKRTPPTMYLPDVVAEDAESNLRTQVLHWYEQGRRVERLLNNGAALEPKNKEDLAAIKQDASLMISIARQLQKEGRQNGK